MTDINSKLKNATSIKFADGENASFYLRDSFVGNYSPMNVMFELLQNSVCSVEEREVDIALRILENPKFRDSENDIKEEVLDVLNISDRGWSAAYSFYNTIYGGALFNSEEERKLAIKKAIEKADDKDTKLVIKKSAATRDDQTSLDITSDDDTDLLKKYNDMADSEVSIFYDHYNAGMTINNKGRSLPVRNACKILTSIGHSYGKELSGTGGRGMGGNAIDKLGVDYKYTVNCGGEQVIIEMFIVDGETKVIESEITKTDEPDSVSLYLSGGDGVEGIDAITEYKKDLECAIFKTRDNIKINLFENTRDNEEFKDITDSVYRAKNTLFQTIPLSKH